MVYLKLADFLHNFMLLTFVTVCAQGHDGMNYVLASREALCDMVEVHGSVFPWDGMILTSSCDKSIPAHLKAAARLNIPKDYGTS